ncbi:MAG: polysaccharide deacetylase family protein [Syntrophorhabdaceae bacterium]|nr:polysaccharide deacetylase family protein [Syntrophorhabdaceae bacterium]
MSKSSFKNTIGIKVDVDTHMGMQKGVPALLEMFSRYNIQVSFFIPMGRDNTGRTVKRIFIRKGFLKKASRVGVLKTYGLRTLLYGILLRGPEIAKRAVHLIQEIIKEGHEVGIHGYDHVYWHDHIKHLSKEKTERILKDSVRVYKEITGKAPLSFAAPGWMINPHALDFFQKNGFVYTSDTRGDLPFYPVMEKNRFSIIQIPTTLPTLDEVVGIEGDNPVMLAEYFLTLLKDDLNILTVHAELEGNRWKKFLEHFIKNSMERGFVFKRLIDVADELKNYGKLPFCEISFGTVRGRAGEVSCHSPPLEF